MLNAGKISTFFCRHLTTKNFFIFRPQVVTSLKSIEMRVKHKVFIDFPIYIFLTKPFDSRTSILLQILPSLVLNRHPWTCLSKTYLQNWCLVFKHLVQEPDVRASPGLKNQRSKNKQSLQALRLTSKRISAIATRHLFWYFVLSSSWQSCLNLNALAKTAKVAQNLQVLDLNFTWPLHILYPCGCFNPEPRFSLDLSLLPQSRCIKAGV